MIAIDPDVCIHCGTCWTICPTRAIGQGPELSEEGQARCISCGHCYSLCPTAAISVVGWEDYEGAAAPIASPQSAEDMLALLWGQRSCRAYEPQPVAREHLEAIVRAASLAASASNARPLRAYVYTKPEVLEAIRAAAVDAFRRALETEEGLSEAERRGYGWIVEAAAHSDVILRGAPAFVVFAGPANAGPAAADAWLAAQNAVLYATTIGVGTCYCGFVLRAAGMSTEVAPALGLASDEGPLAAFMAGYPSRRYLRLPPRATMPTTWM